MSNEKSTNPKDFAAAGRIPLWLLSPIAKAHWALAQWAGLVKYGAWNWRSAGVKYSVYLSAINRHADAILSGETHDPVDGTDHLGNIMACCAILMDARAAGKLIDDRPPIVSHRATYAELEALTHKLAEQYKDKMPRHWTIMDTIEIAKAVGVEALKALEVMAEPMVPKHPIASVPPIPLGEVHFRTGPEVAIPAHLIRGK